jgi:hypothetical protein
MVKLLTLITFCAIAAGCSSTGSVAGNASNAPTAPVAANSGKSPAPASPTDAAAAKPAPAAETAPKRVSFAKGATSSTQNVTLAPGASIKFVLGATGAQTLIVVPGSDELMFKMLKGIGGEFIKAEDGSYGAETKGNNGQRGDILFEVKNTTSKEIKTTLKISIEDFGD